MAAFDVKSSEDPDTRSELDCFPDVDHGIEVAGDRVLVQLRRPKTASKGGIILVEETTQTIKFNETVAKVRQIGPLAYKSPEDLSPWPEGNWCNVGDLVRTIKYGGDRWAVPHGDGEVVFIVLQDREVIGKIDSFEAARTMFPAFVE